MHRLCLSAALLVLLVILVDGTTNDTNKSRDHGLEISHGRGPKKYSLKRIVSKIFDGVHKASSSPSICLDPAFPGPCHKQKMRDSVPVRTCKEWSPENVSPRKTPAGLDCG
ncbi:hypothetical protein AB1E18_010273 [Capra hircus]